MASIAIVPLPEPGHVNAVARLHEELSAAGHEAKYVTTSEHVALFSLRGLPVEVAIAEESSARTPLYRLQHFQPSVVLVDNLLPHVGMWAWRSGFSTINVSTTFPLQHDPLVPPVSVDLSPSSDPSIRMRIEEAWLEECRRHEVVTPEYPESRGSVTRRIAGQLGFPLQRLDQRAALGVVARFPEIVLVPEQLDFPRVCQPQRFYAGPCLELSRALATVSLPRVREGRPLVYCAFGTQVQRYHGLRSCLDRVVAAARLLPDLEFLVASGIEYAVELPENVTFMTRAPQLAVLRRAAAMLSHGGLNGIKEALYFGVPLIVLPFDQDQPGNAARIAFHGLGYKARWEETSASDLAALVRHILGDDAVRARVKAMAEAFEFLNAAHRGAAAVNSCLALLDRRGRKSEDELIGDASGG